MDSPVSSDKDASVLGDFIEDQHHQSPDEYLMSNTLKEDIETVLGTLTRKEADIIRLRFGLGNRRPLSLKEVGDRFHLTKERIRQIEKKAIKRLQHPSRQKLLESYVA
jgi:RNA polymerase primary sigma factor